jgi:hypothetical protein
MSYDETKGRNDVTLFSDADYDYDTYKVVDGSVLSQFLKKYDTDDIEVKTLDYTGNEVSVKMKGVVHAAGKKIKNEPYIMIHVFPVFMIAYGNLIAENPQLMLGGSDVVNRLNSLGSDALSGTAKLGSAALSGTAKLGSNALSGTAKLGSNALSGTAKLGSNALSGTATAVSSAYSLGTSVLGSASSALNSAKSKLSNISIPGNGKSAAVVHRPAFVKISDEHSQYMVLVLNTLAAIDELRAPGWLEAIRATLGSVTGLFDKGSSMNSFISAVSNYDETKNKYRASMYAEVNLLRNDDRMNGQPKCTDAPIDVDIMVKTTDGPSAITKVDSALNAITHDLEEKPEITTNPVGLEAGANPNGKLGKNLIVSNLLDDEFDDMLGGRTVVKSSGRKTTRSLSKHKKRQNKTSRAGLRSQFGIK